MKMFFDSFFVIILLFNSNTFFAQDKIYEWIGKNIQLFVAQNGVPGQIDELEDSKHYVYETELGYQSFIVKEDIIIKVFSMTYWDTKKKAQQAMGFIKKFFISNGFKIEKKEEFRYLFNNEYYNVSVEMKKEGDYYSIFEAIKGITK